MMRELAAACGFTVEEWQERILEWSGWAASAGTHDGPAAVDIALSAPRGYRAPAPIVDELAHWSRRMQELAGEPLVDALSGEVVGYAAAPVAEGGVLEAEIIDEPDLAAVDVYTARDYFVEADQWQDRETVPWMASTVRDPGPSGDLAWLGVPRWRVDIVDEIDRVLAETAPAAAETPADRVIGIAAHDALRGQRVEIMLGMAVMDPGPSLIRDVIA